MRIQHVAIGLILCAYASAAAAGDGVVEINQARALAGGVTPGDTPGFPVGITRSGSYRLTSDLDVNYDGNSSQAADRTAVQIDASNVTLDLGGFSIRGPVTCLDSSGQTTCSPAGGFGAGIVANQEAVVIKNGIVRGMGNLGVLLNSTSVASEVTAISNGFGGFSLADGGIVRDCVAYRNGSDGIFVAEGMVRDSVSRGNASAGIRIYTGIASGNVSTNNHDQGISGDYGLASGNYVVDRDFGGIDFTQGLARDNLVDSISGSTGIRASAFVNNVIGGGSVGQGTLSLGGNRCASGSLCP